MKLPVRVYAQLRDLIDRDTIEIDLPEDATAGEALNRLYAQFAALRPHDKTMLLGVGVEFVNRDYVLQPGDELSLMPPVQGG